jgi:hypothetical protein
MSEDKAGKTNVDELHINVTDPWNLSDWTEKLGFSADKIRHAVATVGTLAKNVRKELNK